MIHGWEVILYCLCIGKHTAGSDCFCYGTWRTGQRGFIVYWYFDGTRRFLNKINWLLCLESSNRLDCLFVKYVSSVHQQARHVLSLSWITAGQCGPWVKAEAGDIIHIKPPLIGLVSRHKRSHRGQDEFHFGVGNQVSDALIYGGVHTTFEPSGSCERWHTLGNDLIVIAIIRFLHFQILLAKMVKSLVVQIDRQVRSCQNVRHSQHSIVRLDHTVSNLGRRKKTESYLGFLLVFSFKAL